MSALFITVIALVVVGFVAFFGFNSFHYIGEGKAGLVFRRVGKASRSLIAGKGESGYLPDLLMPGWRFKLWPIYKVEKQNWAQTGPDDIAVVISQVGSDPAIGAKSCVYKDEFGDFTNLNTFLQNGGERGLQRWTMPPNSTLLVHPAAFIVVTNGRHFGKVLTSGLEATIQQLEQSGKLRPTVIPGGKLGIITTLDGPERESGTIASRLGGFDDIKAMEENGAAPADIIARLIAPKNGVHNNYQNFQKFLNEGGRMGLQHDPIQSGRYLLNPLLVDVQIQDMLVVEQGQVAVVKARVGLPTVDTSGEDYKYGSIVSPGHMGIWSEPLRTGVFPINQQIYKPEIVQTSILTLNWADETSEAHDLDKGLSSIEAKSLDTFDFRLDLQIQIHVPDTQAPMVVGMMRTMQNLVNEVLQPAAGNHFFNTLQKIKAIDFIQQRERIQQEAEQFIRGYLSTYHIEVRGVYIQNVKFPDEIKKVQQQSEIADQEMAMFAAQQKAQEARVSLERQRGVAEGQADLAKAEVSIEVNKNKAQAAIEEATGKATVTEKLAEAEATKIRKTGEAEGDALKAKGVGEAAGYEAKKVAIGAAQTALVAALHEIAEGKIGITPQTVVGSEGGSLGSVLTAVLAQQLNGNEPAMEKPVAEQPAEAEAVKA